MPHYPPKKERIEDHQRSAMVAGNDFSPSFDDLADALPNILGYLKLQDIMRKRRINKKTREAAKMTIVPPTDFRVDCVKNYNAMRVMMTELPNLKQITIGRLETGYKKYNDGEDPNERQAAETADWATHDIEIVSNFSKLRILTIDMIETDFFLDAQVPLNGSYAFLFNSFPLLQKLTIKFCEYLKWDLEMLARLPSLKELNCIHNHRVTGSINSLRILKDTLEKVVIQFCDHVEGNFMDLADFPHLKMFLLQTAVTGDIRDIGENDFSTLEQLALPHGIYSGTAYEFRRISDAPDLVRAVYLLKKQRPTLKTKHWFVALSKDSPDWYDTAVNDAAPFYIRIVKAGSRVGYRWETLDMSMNGYVCEVNWLDQEPEPERGSSGYGNYIQGLQKINRQVNFYKGFHQPPTEEEYRRLCQ